MDQQIYTCIKSLQICSQLFSNIINSLIALLEQSAPDSNELKFLKDKYLIAINRFSNYVSNENLTKDRFVKEIKDILQLIKMLLQNFNKEIIPIIEKYQLQQSIDNLNKMPLVVTKVLENLQLYLNSAQNNIKDNIGTIQEKIGNKGSGEAVSNTMGNNYRSTNSNGLFNPYNSKPTLESIDLFSEGVISGIVDTVKNVLMNGLRLITFRQNSLTKAVNDVNANVTALHNATKGTMYSGTNLENVKIFLKSEALWKSIAGVTLSVGLIYGIYKFLIKAKMAIKKFFTGSEY